MYRTSLIHEKSVLLDDGSRIELSYYLVIHAIYEDCAESYGVEVRERTGASETYAGVCHITMLATRIFDLIDSLFVAGITPALLSAAVKKWLG